jgi:hypothetical protein
MSAPGIQLNSEPHLPHFQPTVRQYVLGIQEAVASNRLPVAQQLLTRLSKAISTAGPGNADSAEAAARIQQSVQALGKALQAGDVAAAQASVRELRQNVQGVSVEQAHLQPTVSTGVPASNGQEVAPADNSSETPTLNVRV